MKVLYKNKIGSLAKVNDIYCHDCIFRAKYASIESCKTIGLMKLCIGVYNYYRFVPSFSDLLTYEN